jgi:hypothetical protein
MKALTGGMEDEEDYDFVSITDCEVRYVRHDDGPSQGNGRLELWWRCLWSTGTTTLEPEEQFVHFRDEIIEFASRHRVSMKNKVNAALKKYPKLDSVESSYYPIPEFDELPELDDTDDEENEGDDSDDDSDDDDVRQAELTVNIENDSEVTTNRTLKAQLTKDGEMLWKTSQVAAHFALHDDANLMVGVGQYLATRSNRRFTISSDVITTGVTLKVWGNATEKAPIQLEMSSKDPRWAAPPWVRRGSYGTSHLDDVYDWLQHSKRTSKDSKAKDFVHNTRRRYYVKNGKLFYKRGLRKAKNLPKRLMRTRAPDIEVLTMDEAWLAVERDHKQYHDGHNRTEERLGGMYMISRVRALTKYARQMCKVYTPS